MVCEVCNGTGKFNLQAAACVAFESLEIKAHEAKVPRSLRDTNRREMQVYLQYMARTEHTCPECGPDTVVED